ncbi:MAG: thioredoxin family protein [Acidobacteria bacterium]|nr:thioredoxin family protein [Acidobacteriota bacterium]
MLTLLICLMFADEMQPLDQVAVQAKAENKLILVDFYAVWCGPCKLFTRDSKSDADMKKLLDKVVLAKYDAEKGIGKEIADSYKVDGYPTFYLLNAELETVSAMTGYEKGMFSEWVQDNLKDPRTIAAKIAGFEQSPSAPAALAIAKFRESESNYKDALAYYEKAAELDPKTDVAQSSYWCRFMLFKDGEGKAEAVIDAAQNLLKTKQDSETTSFVLSTISDVSKEAYTDLLKQNYERLSADKEAQRAASHFKVDYLLLVEQDKQGAYEAKLANLSDDWQTQPNELNNVAWWCFENNVMLAEARGYAVKGIALSEPGRGKAMILDTLAEIEHALGNTGEAIKYMEQAIAEDGASNYYKKQLDRFKKAAQESKSS